MLFNTYTFLIFLSIVIPLYNLIKSTRNRKLLLLLSSYVFYGFWDWRFCALLLLSSFIDYIIGLSLSKSDVQSHRKRLLLLSITSNLSILVTFKYFDFFVDSFVALSSLVNYELDFVHLHLILPVGISFYTFQSLSYTIDLYGKKLEPTKSFLDFALFVSFFPQLVAGPIERAVKLLPQIAQPSNATNKQWSEGITLIIYGLFKKILIGDAAGRYVNNIYGDLELYSSWELLVALFLFSIQIYADFSGYSNIARGTAKLFGFELMKNFEQPYLSRSIVDFWRRWHISLSSWLKDYLYIPLGGNKINNNRTYVNLMTTMLLGGLWHGASWSFMIWGGLHGLYLIVSKMISRKNLTNDHQKSNWLSTALKIIGIYLLVTFSWLFFRLTTLPELNQFGNAMINWTWGLYPLRYLQILLGFVGMTLLFDLLERKTNSHTFILNFNNKLISATILSILLLACLAYMATNNPLPFVYFQF